MKKRKILTVIPIRGGSQGLPNKNIKLLGDKPLVAHVIETAKKAAGINKLIVSTDNEKYISLVNSFGAATPFIRPPHLSSSHIRLIHVIKHALTYFDSIGEYYDAVLSLQATVPLVKSSTIEKVINKFHQTNCLSIGTVSEIRHGHPYLAKKLSGNKNDEVSDFLELDEGIKRYPRQLRPDLYFFNGSIFLRDRSLIENLNEKTNGMGSHPKVVIMDPMEAINIDEEIDFNIAEMLYYQQKKTLSSL